MRRIVLLCLVLVLVSVSVFPSGFDFQLGWETNPLSTGVSLRASNGSLVLNASVQYPIVITLVLAALEDMWLYPMFLGTASVQVPIPVTPKVSIVAGPSVWALSKGIERFVVVSYGLDIGVEFYEADGSELWSLGFMIPVVLQGEAVNSSPNGVAWAWDEFGFAVVPSVRALWRL